MFDGCISYIHVNIIVFNKKIFKLFNLFMYGAFNNAQCHLQLY